MAAATVVVETGAGTVEVMEEGTVEAEKAVEKVVVAMVVGRAAAGMVGGMVGR